MARTKKQLITAATTFSVALGIGTIMQYGDALASRWGADAPVAGPEARLDPDTVVIPVAANMAVPTVLETPRVTMPKVERVALPGTPNDDIVAPRLAVPNATDPAEAVALAEPEPQAVPKPQQAPVTEQVVIPTCEAVLTASPADLAMVEPTLTNSCRPDAVVSIHHKGMMFHDITDKDGTLTVTVPALAEEAFFIAAFDDGVGAVALTGVPELADFDRAVLQWQGEDGVQLHALEFGATYGEPGHIWAESRDSTHMAIAGIGGFLTKLGNSAVNEPLMAEVYTYPRGSNLLDGAVALSVEAEVTPRNCGRDIAAQSIQLIQGAEPDAIDLTMTMPGCDTVGEYLVLKNMFEDLTLAAK